MNARTFSDVLIEPQYSKIRSRRDIDLSTDLGKLHLDLPIISSNMRTITGPDMCSAMHQTHGWSILPRSNSPEKAAEQFEAACDKMPHSYKVLKPLHCRPGVSIGVKPIDREIAEKLYEVGARYFCIDVAHGHHILVKEQINWLRSKFNEEIFIIAGNVATHFGALFLADCGADAIKVGIGPGHVCTTRQKTGVGVPQLTALEEVFKVSLTHNNPFAIIADGGCSNVGDIAKALRYSDAVMLGNMLAGTIETPGKVHKNEHGQFYKSYGGEASGEHKEKNEYVEGIFKQVPFRGHVEYILKEIKEGLQSAFSYVGAKDLYDFHLNCEFIDISNGGQKESKL